MTTTKPLNIPKQLFVEAWRRVKANNGVYGVDQQSLEDFERNLKDNLYKLWNRMSSGTYFPMAVKAVPIPKKSGGQRILGIPTVGDRVCQMVVKLALEPKVECKFLPDSYGYRPHKSALDAIGVTRQRCWKYDWVLEFDIRGLFDNIPHDLMMKAVHCQTQERWQTLYIERWLKAPMQQVGGILVERSLGTPQGGVISPLLSNLFMHYAFDRWMTQNYPRSPWCRYADDGLVHCRTLQEAEEVLKALKQRMGECGLELHPDKTKIVYCKDGQRRGKYPNKSFDFLGYTFRARRCKNSKHNSVFVNFTPAVSKDALHAMRATVRKHGVRNCTHLSLQDIARWYNPILQGWWNYYGAYNRSALYAICRHINKTLVAWATRKYRRFRHRRVWASKFMQAVFQRQPKLFVHWRMGMKGAFA